MKGQSAWRQRLQCSATLTGLYLLTITCAVYLVQPMLSPLEHSRPVDLTQAQQQPRVPQASKAKVIAGRPVRIVIPAEGIDLPVNKGFYDSADNSWTLSGYDAQFAMISTLSNNVGGETFIYGHNNDYVFGALRHHTPTPDTMALIYTDNNHIFEYDFVSATSIGPNSVSILDYAGPPILMIQTCTGSLNEWRTEYKFDFVKVDQ
jgi:sortase (surface protein transpeptidase)